MSSLLVVSSQLSATSAAQTPAMVRSRRRADKHLGSAPAPSLYNAAPPPSHHDEPVDLHNKARVYLKCPMNKCLKVGVFRSFVLTCPPSSP